MKAKRAKLRQVHAIVPLKAPQKSKARLSALLSPRERAQLTHAMLADVLLELRRTRKIDSVVVISADKAAPKIARRFGSKFICEGRNRGLNHALGLAIKKVQEIDKEPVVLIIHADLPLLTHKDVETFLAKSRGYHIALNPSKEGTGTNAMLLNRPGIIRLAFGKNSFKRHLSLAKKKNLRCRVVSMKGISFDIDEPRDLITLTQCGVQNETGRFLRSIYSPFG